MAAEAARQYFVINDDAGFSLYGINSIIAEMAVLAAVALLFFSSSRIAALAQLFALVVLAEAASIAAAPVSDGIRAAVSHAAGLEASPTGRVPAAAAAAVGFTAAGLGAAGDDLDRGRFRGRAVRGGPRVLRDVL